MDLLDHIVKLDNDKSRAEEYCKLIAGPIGAYILDNHNINILHIIEIVKLKHNNTINTSTLKLLLDQSILHLEDPVKYMEKHGLSKIIDKKILSDILEEVFKENTKEFTRFQSGEHNLGQFFMGQVVKKTKGRADPIVILELINNYKI